VTPNVTVELDGTQIGWSGFILKILPAIVPLAEVPNNPFIEVSAPTIKLLSTCIYPTAPMFVFVDEFPLFHIEIRPELIFSTIPAGTVYVFVIVVPAEGDVKASTDNVTTSSNSNV